jgi:hypothetical protein
MIITGLLIVILGPAAIAGVAVLIFLLPAQKSLMGRLQRLRKTVAPITDSRAKLIQEIIAGIMVLQFFTWERSFYAKVMKRNQISKKPRIYTSICDEHRF